VPVSASPNQSVKKPRGMHWRTYLRMRAAAGAAEGASVAMTMKIFTTDGTAD